MNSENPSPSRDAEVDAALARRYRDTTPEFEARWVALKRELRSAPRPRAQAWLAGWLRWGILGGAAAAVILTVTLGRKPSPPVSGEVSPALAELFAMDAVLGRATPLLDRENREVLLHLPASTQPRS